MFTQTLLLCALVVFWYMLALFVTALVRKNNAVADVAWGPGFLLAALATLWWQQPAGLLPVVATVLVAIWGIRLAAHITMRNWGRAEDWRYAKWRTDWGEWFIPRTFAQVFLLQGALLIVVSLPVLWINTFGGTVGWLTAVGAVVWLNGFIWESVGDYQLVQFLRHPENKGKILQSGLWKYTRHPNYFGEVTQWWGMWLIALSVAGGWLTVLGPLTITFLILKVSGVPLLEKKQMENPEFREYAKRTSEFFPWFPGRSVAVPAAHAVAATATLTAFHESPSRRSVEPTTPTPPAAFAPPAEEKPVRKRMGFTAHGYKLAEAFGRGFSERLFGESVPNTNETPFDQLPETDQLAELDRVRSLVAELRDLRRGRSGELAAEPVPGTSQSVFEVNGIMASAPLGDMDDLLAVDEDAVAESMAEREIKIVAALKGMGKRPGLREAYAQSLPMLYMELKKMDQMKELRRKEAALRRAISAYTISSKQTAVGYSVGSNAERVRQLRAKLAEAQEQLKLHDGSSDARIARVMEIEAYAKQYQSGMMMEVPTVVSLKEDLAEDMRARRHYLIAGHLGGGKTELARQAVRQFMIEQGIGYDVERLKSAVQRGDEEEKARIVQDIQPLIYSASEDSSVYDLIGIWKLEARPTPSPEQAAAQAQEMADGFKERGIDLPVEEAVKILMGQANLVETVFRHTALGQAVAEGKPIIIDEINMMRNETRGALNNILTARVGQDVSLPGNGGGRYAIKPGFVALGTLNLGAQYGGTKEFNAAQLSRWVGREMDYPEVSETFDLILAALLRGDRATLPPEFPPEEYARLGALAIVTREVQEIFSGKTPGMMFMARATGMEAGTALLQKSVISPRDLLRGIIEPWRDSGFATSLDDIIAANILARAKLAMGDEQKFLAELFIRRGFFQGWSAKRFRDAGVASVSQKEIDALQAALTSDEFKAQDKWSDAMKDMEARAGMIQSAMLVGNRTLNLVE